MCDSGEEGLKVLSVWGSPFGLRVLIALKEKGVAYEYAEEDLANKSPLLLSANPAHQKVPVLLHNGRAVCESLIILQYIDDMWPSSTPFLPSDPHGRAHARFWADFMDKKFYDAGVRVIRNPNSTIREQAIGEIFENLAIVDAELGRLVSHDLPFFGGQSIGLVDMAFAPFAFFFKTFKDFDIMQLPKPLQCPHLTTWMNLLLEYPSVKEVMSSIPFDKLTHAMTKPRTVSQE